MSGSRVRIENVLSVTMDAQRSVGYRTIVIEEGTIAEVRELPPQGRHIEPADSPAYPAERIIGGDDFVAIPGLVNGHVHGDVVAARGLGDGLTLSEQNDDSLIARNDWFRNQMTPAVRKLSRRLQLAECVLGGQTFVCDVPFWPPGDGGWSDPYREVGLGGAVVVDYRGDFVSGERLPISAVEEAMADLDSAGLVKVIGAPPEEGFRDDDLDHVFFLADTYDALVHIHLAETRDRVALIGERFGTTPARYLHDRGFLTSRLVASHAVYIDTDEANLIRESGARIVNTPVAEMKIADGVAPVTDWIDLELPLGIGTDGAMWNDASDLFGEMKTLMLLHRVVGGAGAISPKEVLEMATCRGAEVFGVADRIGSIEVGKRADIVLLRRNRAHVAPLLTGEPGNIYSNVVSCFRSGDVDTVISAGRVVVEDGRTTTVDEETLALEMQDAGEHLMAGIQ